MVRDQTAAAHIGTARSGSTLFAFIPKLVNNVSKDMQQMTKADNIYQILFFVSAFYLHRRSADDHHKHEDPDQAQHNVGPDLGPNSLTL